MPQALEDIRNTPIYSSVSRDEMVAEFHCLFSEENAKHSQPRCMLPRTAKAPSGLGDDKNQPARGHKRRKRPSDNAAGGLQYPPYKKKDATSKD